jgi:hypothetical protein
MAKRFSSSWWSTLSFGKRSEIVENDFADMGTAFGLDASMESMPVPHDAGATDSDAGHPLTDGSSRHRLR